MKHLFRREVTFHTRPHPKIHPGNLWFFRCSPRTGLVLPCSKHLTVGVRGRVCHNHADSWEKNQILDFLNMKKSPFAHYYVLFAFFWGGFARFLLATCKNISCNTCFLPALGFLEHALQPAPPAPPLEFNEFTICWVVAMSAMLGYLTTSCQVSQMTNDSGRSLAAQTLPKSMTHFNLHFVCWCFMKF